MRMPAFAVSHPSRLVSFPPAGPVAPPQVQAPAHRALSTHPPLQTPGTWYRPLLRFGGHVLNGVLHLRGFHHVMQPTQAGTMHAMVANRGGPLPTLVVLHGLGSEISDYARLLWRLAPHFQRVVAIDLPGHGESELQTPVNLNNFVGALSETVDNLAPGPIVVLGHSLGGMSAMHLALRRRDKVRSMVLCSPAGGPFTPQDREYYLNLFSLRTKADAQYIAKHTWPPSRSRRTLLTASVWQRLCTPAVQSILRSDIFTGWLLPGDLARLPAKTMLIWGGYEALLPSHHADYFTRYLPATSQIWRPEKVAHSTLAMGSNALVKPIIQFFQNACAS